MNQYQKRYAVSHEHRFIYCPIPKAGSTSFKLWALQLAAPDSADQYASMSAMQLDLEFERKVTLGAMRADDAMALLRDKSYFKFAIVRNPWDRLASAYLDKFVRVPDPDPAAAALVDDVHRRRHLSPDRSRSITFHEFVEHVASLSDDLCDPHWRSQYLFLQDIRLDFLGRVERLKSDCAFIRRRIGCTIELAKANAARYEPDLRPSGHLSTLLPYQLRALRGLPQPQQLYTPRLTQLAGMRYRVDVDRFAYVGPTSHGAATFASAFRPGTKDPIQLDASSTHVDNALDPSALVSWYRSRIA